MGVVKKNSKIIAERLKELRQKAHLSHVQLSNKLKEKNNLQISHDSLQIYEVTEAHSRANANLGMRVEFLAALADLYNVTTDYILGRTDDPSRKPSAVDELGLSSSAINKITEMSMDDPIHLQYLNKILESPALFYLLYSLDRLSVSVDREIKQLERVKNSGGDYNSTVSSEDETLQNLIFDLEEKYPWAAGRLQTVSLSESVDEEMETLSDAISLLFETITNYRKLTQLRDEVKESRMIFEESQTEEDY